MTLQMLVQSVRAVARGPGRPPGSPRRPQHPRWTPEKNALLQAFDDPASPPSSWDPGQAVSSRDLRTSDALELGLVGPCLVLRWPGWMPARYRRWPVACASPIHEAAPQEQRDYYMSRCAPAQPGETASPGAAPSPSPTNPLTLASKTRQCSAAKMKIRRGNGKAKNPSCKVEKRGRFITTMGSAKLRQRRRGDSDDPRIKVTCMVILEETRPRQPVDRGTLPPAKLRHQLSSTRDPIFSLRVPATASSAGYSVRRENGRSRATATAKSSKPFFRRTRSHGGIMTSANCFLRRSSPSIRYHRSRSAARHHPRSPRYETGHTAQAG